MLKILLLSIKLEVLDRCCSEIFIFEDENILFTFYVKTVHCFKINIIRTLRILTYNIA